MNAPAPTLLLVEDNEDDAFLMRRALRGAKLDFPLHIVTDGQEALDYLAGADRFGDRGAYPLPSLVLLDLKLPYIHGFQVLGWIRTQSHLTHVPVFVLTSSAEDRDRERAAEFGARGYYVKPPTPELMQAVASALAELNAAPH